MPFLRLQTNKAVASSVEKEILQTASQLVSDSLGKSEDFFMGAVESEVTMLFAGSDDPVASIELKALGLPGAKTKNLSKLLCRLVEEKLSVPKERVYVKFHDVSRGMWGWNGDTI